MNNKHENVAKKPSPRGRGIKGEGGLVVPPSKNPVRSSLLAPRSHISALAKGQSPGRKSAVRPFNLPAGDCPLGQHSITPFMKILAARKYPTPRNGLPSIEETEIRRLAYAIKTIASPLADFDAAAREMAALILDSNPQPSTLNSQPFSCWLVPIPDSTGNTDANARLASHIARHVIAAGGNAQIVKAIFRTQPIQSQCTRHKHALGPIAPEQHHLARTRKALTLRQTYFVDNVTTSGNTLAAARAALGFGAGLVFADAAPRRVQIQATLL